MRPWHPYLTGRGVAYVLPVVVGAWLISLPLWHTALGTDGCGIASIEILGMVAAVLSACLLCPRMASWEVTATSAIRRLTLACCTALVVLIAVTPLIIFTAITRLPPGYVPKSGVADLDGLSFDAWHAMVTNLLTMTSIALLAVAALGRWLGSLLALCALPIAFAISSNTATPAPHAAFCSTEAPRPTWVGSICLVAIALTVWYRTGGATHLSRSIDSRT